ncbi:oligosaccharide flippase family protein [Patescibacteria group bacterium]|nr:oligosaccharide flippase family protein [Patescibacteria group bacterium]
MDYLKTRALQALRWSEQYTKTDMVYLAGSGFWINLGVVLTSLFSLALYTVFARTLSPETYGIYQYFLSAGGLLGALTLTGMNSAVIRAVARGNEGMFRSSLRTQLRWGLIPLAVALCIAGYYFLRGNVPFGVGFVILGIFVPLTYSLNTYGAYLIGKKDFKRSFTYNLWVNLLFYSALILAAFAHASALILLVVHFVSQAIAHYIAHRRTLRVHPPNETTDKETSAFGGHLSVMGILGTVAQQLDNFLVFHFLGPATLAVYAFATAIPDRLGGLLKFIPASMLPMLATQTEEATKEALSWSRMVWVVVLVALLAGAYALIAPFIFMILFPTYMAAIPFSQVYALSMITTVGSIFSAALIAQRQIRSLYVFNTALPVIGIILQFFGIALYGLWGLITAKILVALVLTVSASFLLLRR